MGILDYRKTRIISVAAPPEQCLRAFAAAMSVTGVRVGAVRWRLERTTVADEMNPDLPPRAACVATFAGRAGIGGLLGALSEQGQRAEQAMKGTQITFVVKPEASGGRTECLMWLSYALPSLHMPFGDMLFLRNYMNEVEKQLRLLDPALLVERV